MRRNSVWHKRTPRIEQRTGRPCLSFWSVCAWSLHPPRLHLPGATNSLLFKPIWAGSPGTAKWRNPPFNCHPPALTTLSSHVPCSLSLPYLFSPSPVTPTPYLLFLAKSYLSWKAYLKYLLFGITFSGLCSQLCSNSEFQDILGLWWWTSGTYWKLKKICHNCPTSVSVTWKSLWATRQRKILNEKWGTSIECNKLIFKALHWDG